LKKPDQKIPTATRAVTIHAVPGIQGPRAGRGFVEAVMERKKNKTGKYFCSRCGKPLTLQQCWVGNDGLLCRDHVGFRSVETTLCEREGGCPPDCTTKRTERRRGADKLLSWVRARGRVA
jgi:hypothetical protein